MIKTTQTRRRSRLHARIQCWYFLYIFFQKFTKSTFRILTTETHRLSHQLVESVVSWLNQSLVLLLYSNLSLLRSLFRTIRRSHSIRSIGSNCVHWKFNFDRFAALAVSRIHQNLRLFRITRDVTSTKSRTQDLSFRI